MTNVHGSELMECACKHGYWFDSGSRGREHARKIPRESCSEDVWASSRPTLAGRHSQRGEAWYDAPPFQNAVTTEHFAKVGLFHTSRAEYGIRALESELCTLMHAVTPTAR